MGGSMPPARYGARLRFLGMRGTCGVQSDRAARDGSRAVAGLPMTTHMTPDAQTQAIPGVPTTVIAVRDSEVAPDPEAEDARTEWVQEKYEAAGEAGCPARPLGGCHRRQP